MGKVCETFFCIGSNQMTVNMSFKRANPMTKGIDTFYTDLHSAMYDLGDLDSAPFPTAKEFREFLKHRFPEGMNGLLCLDAGCGGTAINTRSMVVTGAHGVVAVDLNQKSLDLARKGLERYDMQKVSFKQASLLDLPFANDTFDMVVASGVVHHTPDPEKTLRELFRVAKPGATFYISVYCFERSWVFTAVKIWRLLAWILPFRMMHALFKSSVTVNNFVLDHMYVPLLWVYREANFVEMLKENGFAMVSTFRSVMDPWEGKNILGYPVSGDGLLRVFICEKV